MLLFMVYAPWVNEWFDNIAGLVDLDEVGGFFSWFVSFFGWLFVRVVDLLVGRLVGWLVVRICVVLLVHLSVCV